MASLRYALTDIRARGWVNTTGVFCTERDVVSLKAGAVVVVDAVEISSASPAAMPLAVLRQAASLYTGDLLEGIETRASGFDGVAGARARAAFAASRSGSWAACSIPSRTPTWRIAFLRSTRSARRRIGR